MIYACLLNPLENNIDTIISKYFFCLQINDIGTEIPSKSIKIDFRLKL